MGGSCGMWSRGWRGELEFLMANEDVGRLFLRRWRNFWG